MMNLLSKTSWAFLLLITATLVLQANHPTWQNHLQNDVIVHQEQVKYYQKTGSWSNIKAKDYQPGALWLFLLPSLFGGPSQSFNAYLNITLFINILLIIGHFYLYKHFGPPGASIFFLILLLAMGPLLLFRFDLAVTSLVLLTWLSFTHQRLSLAGFLLGVAIATKLYPIVLLPIMAAQLLKNYLFRKFALFSLSVFLGATLIVAPFLISSGSLIDISDSFDNYLVKPVGLESLWASGLTIIWQIKSSTRPAIDGSHYIQGIAPSATFLSQSFYNNFWLFPVGLITLFIIQLFWSKKYGYAYPIIPLTLLTTFVISLKVLAPQYLWWAFSFVPLINFSNPRAPKTTFIMPIILVATLVLTQLIYPINYSQFISWFQDATTDPGPFLISLERNILLIIFFILLLSQLWSTRKPALDTKTGPSQ
ncbi:MAG: hypothetical protein ABIH36_02825 [bacterium]